MLASNGSLDMLLSIFGLVFFVPNLKGNDQWSHASLIYILLAYMSLKTSEKIRGMFG